MWTEKDKPTRFDKEVIPGLFYLDGGLVGKGLPYNWIEEQKYPMIAFPSGVVCELWESSDPEGGIVHLFGDMDLPLCANRDEAYIQARQIAPEEGAEVEKVGEDTLEIWGQEGGEHIRVTYDNQNRLMVNVEPASVS